MAMSKHRRMPPRQSRLTLHYTAVVKIELLCTGEEERLRNIRLRALQDTPDAFGTTADDAAARRDATGRS